MARYESTRGTGAVPGSIIDEAQSGVELADIALRQAREDLTDRVVLAPFAGDVGSAPRWRTSVPCCRHVPMRPLPRWQLLRRWA